MLEKLRVEASNTWMVGDDLVRDIAPCRELGIYTIWVDGRGTGLSASDRVKPDKIIKSISELKKLITV
jgi:FMN phosphatase YigB (HAD superfamily)